ncbi:MAG: hypothetical protein QM783_14320 [Phycisphaerales bacterium]
MFFRSLASLAVLAVAGMTFSGCSSNREASDDTVYAKSTAGKANNTACPVCGMQADAQYSVTEGGKTLNCCSQECCDKFNKATSAERQRMTNKVWNTNARSSADSRNAYAEAKHHAMNDACPMDGKSSSGKYVVDMDGEKVSFCSQQCADLYRSYGPEHRSEIRNRAQ